MSRLFKRREFAAVLLMLVLAIVAAACAPVAAPAPAATTAPAAATAAPAAATAAPAAATSALAATMQDITFQAGYLPQGNISFIAPYVAKEKGFFEQVGLNVTIEHTARAKAKISSAWQPKISKSARYRDRTF